MNNISKDISWLDRIIKRYKETGLVIPALQLKLYEKVRDHWVGGRTVIDVGCSIGIGSNILSHTARAVWGVDVNPEAIDFASKVFRRPSVDFAILDLENPPTRELSKFEVIVMSEVLEHLENPEVGLQVIKRFFSTKSTTIGFITVPNINNPDVAKRDAENKLHLSHWNAGTFYELMTKHFNSVVLYSVDNLEQWNQEETIDGNSTAGLIVAKVENPR